MRTVAPCGRASARRRALGCVFTLLAGGLLSAGVARADEAGDRMHEARLRAGYLLNFAKFVEWPTLGPAEPFTLCFLGGSSVRDAMMEGPAGHQVGYHVIVTRMLAPKASPEGCRLLYVADDGQDPHGSAVAGAAGLLTVGEARDFLDRGGIVGLFPENNRLRFNINLDNARRSGLKISSNLLQLASKVEEAGR